MTDQDSPDTRGTRIVVVGGGYAGTVAANRLQSRAEVTLVNPRPVFVERIRLHQLVAGTGTATVDYATLLGDGVRLVVDTATMIDTTARTVCLASGDALDYDHVVYAVGSTGAAGPAVPGADRFAFPVAELERAERLRAVLAATRPDAPVTVVGAGHTGIEVAAELAEQGRTVRLVCGGSLAPTLSGTGRRSVARRLGRLGVDVRETATVAAVRSDHVLLRDGADPLPSAVTIWAAGFGTPDLASRSGLRTDALGRLLTDETLTSLDDDRVVAAGDAAAPSGRPLRMSCQAAIPLGVQAADTVRRRIDGADPIPLVMGFNGSILSLGRRAATVQLSRRDDSAVPAAVGGRAGASVKEIVCRATLWRLRREARSPGSGHRPPARPRDVAGPVDAA